MHTGNVGGGGEVMDVLGVEFEVGVVVVMLFRFFLGSVVFKHL